MTFNFSVEGITRATVRDKEQGNPTGGQEAAVILRETGVLHSSVFATDVCDKLERDDFILTITN